MISEIFSMEGRVCVVTGGSRGLGRTMAEAFLEAGADRVYITARKTEEVTATAAELTERFDGDCIGMPRDLSTLEETHAFAADLAEREDYLDVLVNNAGRGWLAPLGHWPEKGWDKVMDLNVKSPFFLTEAL